MLRKWQDLPEYMRTDEVKPYYDILQKKRVSLFVKRLFDIVFSALFIVLLSPAFLLISLAIVSDSKGEVFYRQDRVTCYGKVFRIFKFRTMVTNADKMGSQVTIQDDNRITKVGRILRKYRLDEIPQLLNILIGDMTFCGTRPESVIYVKKYSPEMYATLLLPAGVTSETSIIFKNESEMLQNVTDIDEFYVSTILPQKMKYNLDSIRKFSLFRDFMTLFKTIIAVIK